LIFYIEALFDLDQYIKFSFNSVIFKYNPSFNSHTPVLKFGCICQKQMLMGVEEKPKFRGNPQGENSW